jgi:hypothetical protein
LALGRALEKFVGDTMADDTGDAPGSTSLAAKKQVAPFCRLVISSSRLANLVFS